VTIQGGEVEYILPGRNALNVAGMADDVSTLKQEVNDFKQTVDVTIADKFLAVDQTIVDLNVKTQGAITEVKENFKETVDATLTPAVDTLTAASEDLKFRVKKLEATCNYATSWQKTPASGSTLENFKAPVCETTSVCNAEVEFQTGAPTVNSDRVCKTIRKCTATQYSTAEATVFTDRQCDALRVCTSKEQVFMSGVCIFVFPPS
jgi:hypothetical protein